MLAKINNNYYGVYGDFHEETGTVEIKTRESAPFNVDDALFDRLSRKGVLVAAGKETAKTVQPEKAPEEATTKADDVDDMDLNKLSLKELKEVAKEYGVSFKVGMTKVNPIEAIKGVQSEEPPMFTVETPE